MEKRSMKVYSFLFILIVALVLVVITTRTHSNTPSQKSSSKRIQFSSKKAQGNESTSQTPSYKETVVSSNSAQSSSVPKNEYTKDGAHQVSNGGISVNNKLTKNKDVVISKPDIDAGRTALNKAGLPGNAYSDSDIAQLIVKANRNSLDIVTVAKGSTK